MRWTIEPDGDDLMLIEGRRARLWGATEDEVKRYLRKHMTSGDEVRRVEPDGSITTTRDAPLGRRHWRS
jgi:hypothetical protein